MNFYAQLYIQGGDYYDVLAAEFGTEAANIVQGAALRDAGDGVEVRKALTQVRSMKITGKTAAQINSYYTAHSATDTGEILLTQLYNEPFTAPIDQLQKVVSNTATAAGDAVKKTIGQNIGNVGVWIIGAVIVVGLFFYFGGAAVVRRKVSSIK